MKYVNLFVLATTMLFLCNTSYAERTVWYVHPDSALNTIQAGLDSCADNDIALVGPGTYYENIVWPNTQGIHLISELGPDVTIVDGDSTGSVIACTTNTDTTTLIDGFTLQNGFAMGGGGIFCYGASPTIKNNVIIDNKSERGAGICLIYSSSIITGNTISDNTACHMGHEEWWGGGIAIMDSCFPLIIGNTISDNDGGFRGGAICCCYYVAGQRASMNITNNNIIGNVSGAGGGIFIADVVYAFIDSCTISANSSDGISIGYAELTDSIAVHYCNIFDNIGYGIRNESSLNPLVNAENNWWGDASGPYHPSLNPGGLGDTVSDYVDFEPWLSWPVGVEEQPIVSHVEKRETITATILRDPLQLPQGKKCKVFDIMGRVVEPTRMTRGIYFLEVEGCVVQKVVRIE